MATIKADTSPRDAVLFSLLGGSFRLRRIADSGMFAVLDDDGNEIGHAHNVTYGNRGFSVWTRPFAGFVPIEQIEFV